MLIIFSEKIFELKKEKKEKNCSRKGQYYFGGFGWSVAERMVVRERGLGEP